MAVPAIECHSRLNGPRALVPRLICLVLCLSVLVSLPGCGGCSCRKRAKTQAELDREKEDEERRLQLERERKKPPLEADWLISEPYDPRAKTNRFCYKPGHWTAGMMGAKANHDDIMGELEIAVVDADGKPMGLVATPHTLSTERSVALPKKQPKRLESQVFVPNTPEKPRLTTQITTKRGGQMFEGPVQAPTRLPAHVYHFVVLARWPERYSYLEKLDSCRLPQSLTLEENDQELYRIVLLQAEKQTTVPAHSLFWTSTACVLWDDAEPDALSVDQQKAMVDWLHWGGQLIISGPDSLNALKNSFLGPYLPATAAGSREIQKDDLAALNQHWPVDGTLESSKALPLAPKRAWSGVKLKVHPDARYVPKTGDLVVERRVGRGRIVVSTFALNGNELTGWHGFDAFFNGCLLSRSGRTFAVKEGLTDIRWGSGASMFDPWQLCQLRFFTRDTRDPAQKIVLPTPQTQLDASLDGNQPSASFPDVASWSDDNPVANAARDSLKNAARIEIPHRSFVVWVVSVYLVVLVPLNWLLFRGLGRVEWAWVAAPLIAVACTALVIRLAQLDIGFARSATEIGAVELQDGYRRAHVTRYSAMYTSLSTEYKFRFDEPGAQALPFPTRLDDLTVRFGRTNLRYRYDKDTVLEGLRVLSNSTGLVHSEQMLDLGGGISLATTKEGKFELVNDTDLALHGAGVMRLDEQDRLYVAWLDEIEPQSRRPVRFEYRPTQGTPESLWSVYRDSRPETAPKPADGQAQTNRSRTVAALNIRALTDLAEKEMLGGNGSARNDKPRPGDARLIAWIDQPLPGMQVEPAAPQSRHVSLVLAHLRHGHRPDPESDHGTRAVLEEPKKVLEMNENP